MLSPEEAEAIEEEISTLPERRAASIGALRVVQRHRGWVCDEALADVARFLGTSEAELEGVATFYNLIFRKPVGKHVIFLCDSVSCWIMGCPRIKRALADHLQIDFGQTTADGRFTLLPIQCLGACDRAPALMIDEHLHQRVDARDVPSLLADYD